MEACCSRLCKMINQTEQRLKTLNASLLTSSHHKEIHRLKTQIDEEQRFLNNLEDKLLKWRERIAEDVADDYAEALFKQRLP